MAKLDLFYTVVLALSMIILRPPLKAQDSAIDAISRFAQRQGISGGEDCERQIRQGLESFTRQDFAKAVEYFGQASLTSPRHPLPGLYLASSLFALKHYLLAGKVMRRTVALYPDWPNLPLNFRKLFPDREKFSAELAQFENWAFQESRPADVYFLLGFLHQFSGQEKKAEVAYRVAISRNALCREAYEFLSMLLGKPMSTYGDLRARGNELIREKQYLTAVDTWGTACVEYPGEAEPWYALSYCLAAAQLFAQSAQALKMAIRKGPEKLPEQMKAQGPWMQADLAWLTALEQQCEKQVDAGETLFLLSYFYMVAGEKKKAKIAWEHAGKKHPELQEFQELGKALKIAPDPGKKETGEEAKKPDPPGPEIESEEERQRVSEGKNLFREQKYPNAAQVLSQVVVNYPKNAEAQWLLGLTTFATGQYSYSCKFFKALFGQEPLPQWDKYYADSRHLNEQLEQLTEWVQKHPDDDSALLVLGVILLGCGRGDQAQSVFSTLKNRLGGDPQAEYGYQAALKMQKKK